MSGHRPGFKSKSSPDRAVAEPIETSFAKVVGLIERALRMRPFFEAYNAADKKVPALLTQMPWTQNLSTVTRAVCAKHALKVQYLSPSSGAFNRELEPVALAANSLRWHLRAFDLTDARLGDFDWAHAVKPDFAMEEGVLRLRARAALAGYTLGRWLINCSPDHSLDAASHHLWLRNPQTLYGVESAVFALGVKERASLGPL